MKKIAAGLSSLYTYLVLVPAAYAQGVNIQLTDPGRGVEATTPIGLVISRALSIVYIVATLVVLFYIVLGAFNWITSGGDKEKVGAARKQIFAALVGLALLALALLITNTVAQLLGFGNIFDLRVIPSLRQTPVTNTP